MSTTSDSAGGDACGREGGAQFPPTRWTVIHQAKDGTEATAYQALSTLCRKYWYPLYAFARRFGLAAPDAEDAVQGFFCVLLEKDFLASVRQEKGRFRSFMLVALKHYLLKEREKQKAQKRGGSKIHISIDAEFAENRYQLEPVDGLSPDVMFDRKWAMAVMECVMRNLREYYQEKGKAELFTELKPFLDPRQAGKPYREVAEKLAMSENTLRQTAHQMRKQYRRILEEELADSLADPSEVEAEARDLFAAFSS